MRMVFTGKFLVAGTAECPLTDVLIVEEPQEESEPLEFLKGEPGAFNVPSELSSSLHEILTKAARVGARLGFRLGRRNRNGSLPARRLLLSDTFDAVLLGGEKEHTLFNPEELETLRIVSQIQGTQGILKVAVLAGIRLGFRLGQAPPEKIKPAEQAPAQTTTCSYLPNADAWEEENWTDESR